MDATGSIGVPELDVKIGGGIFSVASPGVGSESRTTRSAAAGTASEAGNDCVDSEVGSTPSSDALARIDASTTIRIGVACDDASAITPSLVRVIEKNDVLLAALVAAEHEPSDVVDVRVPAPGVVTLIVAVE